MSFGQIINEIDPDQAGTDNAEFIEIKWTANTSLDGLVIVLYNGSDDQSYAAYDLDGNTTDANGFYVLNLPSNGLQNGADAVALFTGNDSDFPNDTPITTTNLIDVVVYGTNDGDDTGLLNGFGETTQFNDTQTESIQLVGSTYVSATPTPGAENPTSVCTITLGDVTYTCNSNTIGGSNDSVTINIPYTSSDAGVTSVTTTSGGVVGGDDPSGIADGTLTITGLSEGDAWDITINGGDCDGTTASGTVPANECDPAPSTCFDLSNGPELFEIVTVAANSDGDEWTESSGTYAINGFCGGGCMEESNGWLVFGPLDMTGVSDFSLLFDAVEGFDGSELNIQYTSDYSSLCPSGSTWTSAQTISDAGSYTIDLSAASGTDVFVGIQYLDSDGSFSSWSISNVTLGSFGSCPTLGSRPTSTCASCDLALQTENYVCTTNTAGDNNDTVTIEIPYIGSEDTIVSIATTSGGTIGGDDPSGTADGTITITGLSEGSAWDLIINGGDCDGTTVSGTIPSSICDPTEPCPASGAIIITEIMQNPSAVGDGDGEYFEVYNTTGTDINLNGWLITDLSSASENFTVMGSLIVPANGYAVFGVNGDSMANGGLNVDYVYSGLFLGNGTDELSIQCGGTPIDEVTWDNGATFPDPNGASMQLDLNFYDATSNDNGANWFVGTLTYGAGDIGTPGTDNETLSLNQFDATSFSIFPNPNNTGVVTITSSVNEEMNVQVFDLLGKQVKNETLTNNTLNVSNLKTGIYLVKITQNNATVTKKLVIK
ncbi:MAG: hypothetical protein Wins2KO_07580 [Winogradskyella sp.]